MTFFISAAAFVHKARYMENRSGDVETDAFEKEVGELTASAYQLLKESARPKDVD